MLLVLSNLRRAFLAGVNAQFESGYAEDSSAPGVPKHESRSRVQEFCRKSEYQSHRVGCCRPEYREGAAARRHQSGRLANRRCERSSQSLERLTSRTGDHLGAVDSLDRAASTGERLFRYALCRQLSLERWFSS